MSVVAASADALLPFCIDSTFLLRICIAETSIVLDIRLFMDDEDPVDAGDVMFGSDSEDLSDLSDFTDSEVDEEGVKTISFTGDYEADHNLLLDLMREVDDEAVGEANYQPIRTEHEVDIFSIPLDPISRDGGTFGLKSAGYVLNTLPKGWVIQSSESSNTGVGLNNTTVELYTAVYDKNGQPLGRVADIFSSVDAPFFLLLPAAILNEEYPIVSKEGGEEETTTMVTITNNTPKEDQLRITLHTTLEEGQEVFFASNSVRVLAKNLYKPGTDASDMFDEETNEPDSEPDFDQNGNAKSAKKTNNNNQQANTNNKQQSAKKRHKKDQQNQKNNANNIIMPFLPRASTEKPYEVKGSLPFLPRK